MCELLINVNLITQSSHIDVLGSIGKVFYTYLVILSVCLSIAFCFSFILLSSSFHFSASVHSSRCITNWSVDFEIVNTITIENVKGNLEKKTTTKIAIETLLVHSLIAANALDFVTWSYQSVF